MVYIPRRQQKRRLDSRVGQVIPVPPVASRVGHESAALAKVLDTMANKMAPAILSFYQQENHEETKKDYFKHRNDFKEEYKNRPQDANKEWMDDLVSRHMQAAKKSGSFDQWQEVFRNDLLSSEIQFDTEYVNKRLPTLKNDMSENSKSSYRENIRGVDVNDRTQITAFNQKYMNEVAENLIRVQELKLGRSMSDDEKDEFFTSSEAEFAYREAEKFIHSENQNKAISRLRSMSVKDGITMDVSIEKLNLWLKGPQSEKEYMDLYHDGKFNFLQTLDDLGISKEDFHRKAKKAVADSERGEQTLDKLEVAKEFSDNITAFNNLYGPLNTAIENNDKKGFENHIKDFRDVIERLPPKYRDKYRDYMRAIAWDVARKKYHDGDITRHFMDSFKSIISNDDWTKVPWGDPNKVIEFFSKKEVPVEHFDKLSGTFLRFHKMDLSKYGYKIKSIVKEYSHIMGVLDSLDNPESLSGMAPVGSGIDNRNQALQLSGKPSVHHGKLLSKYQRIKYEVSTRFQSVIFQLQSGQLTFNEKDENFVGNALRDVNREVVHGNVYTILSDIVDNDKLFAKVKLYPTGGMHGKPRYPHAHGLRQMISLLNPDNLNKLSAADRSDVIEDALLAWNQFKKDTVNAAKEGLSDKERNTLQEFGVGIKLLMDIGKKTDSEQIAGVLSGESNKRTLGINIGRKK